MPVRTNYYEENRSRLPKWRYFSRGAQMDLLLNVERFCVLDTETTGIYGSHRVCELAMQHHGDSDDEWQRYFNPGMKSDPVALQTHRLSSRFLSSHGQFRNSIATAFGFMEGCTLVGWNLKFDLRMIGMELLRASQEPPKELLQRRHLDAMELAKQLHPRAPRKLVEFSSHIGIAVEDYSLHRAADDVRLTTEVLRRLLKELAAKGDAPAPVVQDVPAELCAPKAAPGAPSLEGWWDCPACGPVPLGGYRGYRSGYECGTCGSVLERAYSGPLAAFAGDGKLAAPAAGN